MANSVDVVAPVPGLVANVVAKVGATVAAVLVREGQEVDLGAVLARVRTA